MRRILLLLVLLSAAGIAAMKLRGQPTPATAPGAPSWPPISPRADPAARADSSPQPSTAAEPVPDRAPLAAVADLPDDTTAPAWKPVNPDGSMPDGYAIKANGQSMIFHVPSGRFYDRTKPERCYATEAAAEADGYRRSKS